MRRCPVCKQHFSIVGNFSWRCWTHTQPFLGLFWPCCGREGVDAQGCVRADHPDDGNPAPYGLRDDKFQGFRTKEFIQDRFKNAQEGAISVMRDGTKIYWRVDQSGRLKTKN